MRIALLSAVKRTPAGELRAELDLAGRSVLAWQVEWVRSLGCERIICLCEAPRGPMLAIQRAVESEGGEFHAIRTMLQLVSLVRAEDELVLLADGVLPGRTSANDLIREAGAIERQIATIPAGHALAEAFPEDFERIDRDRHWAGFAALRASQVHKLADLPPDGDPVSLILRLALQAQTECRDYAQVVDADRWLLAADDAVLEQRENDLIQAGAPPEAWTAPLNALAGVVVRRLGTARLASGPEVTAGLGLLAMIAGSVGAGFGWGATGLGFAALGAFSVSVGTGWARLRQRLWGNARPARIEQLAPLAVDGIALTCLTLAYAGAQPSWPAFSLALLAIGLARLFNPMGSPDASTGFWRDRSLQLAGFACAAAFGVLGEALAMFCIAALAHYSLLARRMRLTGA